MPHGKAGFEPGFALEVDALPLNHRGGNFWGNKPWADQLLCTRGCTHKLKEEVEGAEPVNSNIL